MQSGEQVDHRADLRRRILLAEGWYCCKQCLTRYTSPRKRRRGRKERGVK